MPPSPSQQIQALRDWQTLASYVRYQGGQVGTSVRNIEQEVCGYFRAILCDDDLTPQEIVDGYLPAARRAMGACFEIRNWKNYLKSFQSKIHLMHAFRDVPKVDRDALVGVVAAMTGRLSVDVGGSTENNAGAITVARDVIDEGQATAMFALFHELGHGVQTDRDVPASIKAAIYRSSETGMRYGELFADAFAAHALRALCWQPERILDGAQGALAGHGEDGDHPDWSTRAASIRSIMAGLPKGALKGWLA
jgi:hypothetical protein